MTKSSLAKKLTSYSAIAAGVLLGKQVNAQVVYTPVNAELTEHDTVYLLDLNNDGVIDYKIKANGSDSVISINACNGNEIESTFVYGKVIDNKNTGWYNNVKLNFDSCSVSSMSSHSNTGYLPLKFHASGKIYYGWMRLSLTGNHFVISDFAYNSSADSGIYAGQQCGIQFTAPVIVQHDDTLMVQKSSNKFSAGYTFQWYDKYANAIPNIDCSNFLPVCSGQYYVIATDSTGCISEPSKPFRFISPTTILSVTDDISVSENNNLLKVKFMDEPYYGYRLLIYNCIGQKVFSCEINGVSTIANLQPLKKGFYLVAVEKDDKRIVKKIVIV